MPFVDTIESEGSRGPSWDQDGSYDVSFLWEINTWGEWEDPFGNKQEAGASVGACGRVGAIHACSLEDGTPCFHEAHTRIKIPLWWTLTYGFKNEML